MTERLEAIVTHRRDALAARHEAGVGEQEIPCPHDDPECAAGKVPCFQCLIGGKR